MKIGPLLVGAGAGVGVLLLLNRRAYATEDETGQTLTPAEVKREAQLPPGTPPSLGTKAVEVGLRLRDQGIKEEPKGSNRGPGVDPIIRGVRGDGEKLIGQPWCGRFVRYCFEKAAEEAGLPPPFADVKDSLAAVLSWRDRFKGYEIKDPKPGAVGLLIKTGLPGVDAGKRHATLVVRTEGNKVVTVEGNHSDAVAVVTRPKGDFAVFLDIDRYVADRKQAPKVAGLLGLDVFTAAC